jgi:hypothetical protein
MKILLATLLLLAGADTAQAQVSKFSLGLGIGLVPLHATGPEQANPNGYSGIQQGYVLKTTDVSYLLLNANLGFDAPLWQFAGGEQALGVSLNAALGILKSPRDDIDGLNGAVLVDFPEYLTYRYGARASKHAKHDFGLGVGVGYRYCRFALPFSAPSAMLEGVYSGTHTDWFVRLSADLRARRFYDYYSSEGLVEVLRMQQFALLIGKSF